MSTHLCAKLFGGVDYTHVLIASVVQHFFGWLWYHGLFESIYNYYSAADKGVKRAEHIKIRFGEGLCLLGSFLSAVGRSLTLFAVVKNLGLTSLENYHEAAMMIACVVLLAQHHSLWAQRPLPLILINAGYEIACALIAAVILFSLNGVVFF